jgi:hypothetical protein
MTKIETLELGVENLKTQIQALDEKEWEIRERKGEELTNAFSLFFQNDLDKNITIEYSRGSIYFKMKEDDREYLKEIFTIYLKEDWEKENNEFINVSLSYYTTSTNSDFELIRLENLGKIASVVRNSKTEILQLANSIHQKYMNEISKNGCLEQRWELEKTVRETNQKITQLKREQMKEKLFGEGIVFEKNRQVQLKHDFTPTIGSLKLIPNKSGKTATAEFTYYVTGPQKHQVENVNIERVVRELNL